MVSPPTDPWGKPIPSQRGASVILDSLGNPYPLRDRLVLPAGFSLADDPVNNQTVVSGGPVSGGGTKLTGTTDWDFTGLAGNAVNIQGYVLHFDVTFSAAGQLYFQLNGDAGNNYDDSWQGTTMADPTTFVGSRETGVTLVNIGFGSQLTVLGKVAGKIEFSAVKSGNGRRLGTIQTAAFDTGTGNQNKSTQQFSWNNSIDELTRIRVRHTGTVSSGSCTLVPITGS